MSEDMKKKRKAIMIEPDLHERLKIRAAQDRIFLNEWVKSALADALSAKAKGAK